MTGSPPIALLLLALAIASVSWWIARRHSRSGHRAADSLAAVVAGKAELLATAAMIDRRRQILGEPATDQMRGALERSARDLGATLDALAAEIRAGLAAAPMPTRRGSLDALRDEGLAVRAVFLASTASRAGRALAAARSGEIDAELETLKETVAELAGIARLVG